MARKKAETAADHPSKEIKARGKLSRAKKCMKTTTKKVQESVKHNSGRKEKSPFKFSAGSPSPQDQRLIHTEDRAQEIPVLDLHSGKEVQPSGKMKLQLFPVDAHTREELEKDGCHPYLELTLSSRKKVSSVLQHIHSKWGSSEIARGDPTLYPYDKSGHKWVANSNITTGDVYEAIGAPSLFRLRYGWSSQTENKTDEPPSPSTPGIACFQNEESHNKTESASFTEKQMFGLESSFTMLPSENQVTDLPPLENLPPDGLVESTENKINDGSGPTLCFWDDGLTSLSIGGLLSEVSLKGNFGNHSKNSDATLWVDNLTNISIGGFFPESSLQERGKNNHEQQPAQNYSNDHPSESIGGLLSEAKLIGEARFSECKETWETRRAIKQQPSSLISDSLDAFLVNQTDQPRAPCLAPPPEPSHSSIFDAEDTCHAFSFGKGATTSLKVSAKAEEQQKDDSRPSKPLFGSTVFNQDSSLGFSGIKWAESRGPFDFGLSSSRKFTNGDSVSFSAVVKNSQEMVPLEEKIKIDTHDSGRIIIPKVKSNKSINPKR